MAVSAIAATDVTAVAYNPNTFLPVGAGASANGVVVFGTWAQVPATDNTSRVWRATATLTLADVTLDATNTVDPTSPTAAEATAARQAAIVAAIADGIMVDITLIADIIQMTGLVGGPMAGQSNLEQEVSVTMIADEVVPVVPAMGEASKANVKGTEKPVVTITKAGSDALPGLVKADFSVTEMAGDESLTPTFEFAAANNQLTITPATTTMNSVITVSTTPAGAEKITLTADVVVNVDRTAPVVMIEDPTPCKSSG